MLLPNFERLGVRYNITVGEHEQSPMVVNPDFCWSFA